MKFAAFISSVITFQAPERDDDRNRDSEFLFDAREERRMIFHLLHAVLITATAGHPVRKLQEALIEHALRAVAAHDARVERHIIECERDGRARNPLSGGVLFEILKPAFE